MQCIAFLFPLAMAGSGTIILHGISHLVWLVTIIYINESYDKAVEFVELEGKILWKEMVRRRIFNVLLIFGAH